MFLGLNWDPLPSMTTFRFVRQVHVELVAVCTGAIYLIFIQPSRSYLL
eukprot:SAG11_NODE_32840_length_280_cov_1.082873_1_plen_47_part_10